MEVAVVEGLVCDGSDEVAVAAAIVGAEGGPDAGVGGEARPPRIRISEKTNPPVHTSRDGLLIAFLSSIGSFPTGPV